MMTKLGSSRMALRSSMKAAPTRVSGYCQVDENRCDRPTRYCGRSPSWADMLGIRIGLMPQLDSARVALLSQHTEFVERQFVERVLCLETCAGNEHCDSDQDGGKGEDACVVNRHAGPSRS